MPYEVQINALGDHVRVHVSGVRIPGREVEDSVGTWKQVADVCRETGIEKILTIFEIEGRLSPIDAYDIVARTKEFGWSHAFKMALVDLNPESLDDNVFAETVAVNRAYQIMVFDNEAEARDWLLN